MQNHSLRDQEHHELLSRFHGERINVLKGVILFAGSVAGIAVLNLCATDSNDRAFVRSTPSVDFQRGLQGSNGTCTLDCCSEYEDDICGASDNSWISAIPVAIQIILIVVLLALSALFSGLTLGLMSLDASGLEIVMSGDDPEAARFAKRIYPIRKDGNLLLCTLVLGNVSVNALVSILMAEYTGGVVGLISSTFLIVILGEITPQAAVS
jgi:Cyclin M transmembrane N-terminal domain